MKNNKTYSLIDKHANILTIKATHWSTVGAVDCQKYVFFNNEEKIAEFHNISGIYEVSDNIKLIFYGRRC